MLNAYLPAYRRTLELLHRAKKRPFRNRLLWLKLQEKLIVSITRIENRIRKHRLEIREIKAYLGNRANNVDRFQATDLKDHVSYLKDRIETEYHLLFQYRSIGDSIAFTFIDRHDIKPQAEKQSAGFISNKKGNRAERRALRHVFNTGGIAVLNDLTNYLRFSDLTIIHDYNDWIPFEIKSGKASARNARATRQLENSEKLFNYIFDGGTLEIPGTDWTRRRVAQTSRTKDHVKKFNKLIIKARQEGSIIEMLEEGFGCLISYSMAVPRDIKKMFNFKSPPHAVFLNKYKNTETMGVPLLMLFSNPDHYIDFLAGEIHIMIVFDVSILDTYAKKQSYRFLTREDRNFPYEFVPKTEDRLSFHVSDYAISKIFFQLLSPKWWVKETIDSLNHPSFTEPLKDIKVMKNDLPPSKSTVELT